MQVEHDFGQFTSLKQVERSIKQAEVATGRKNSRRQAFWREVQAMIRLSSPHTVTFYGVVTSRNDRLVLVMELLPGGDLRALLRDSVETLAETRARSIISDMCAGMSFLHRKETIHGDLKSANVLFDGAGRVKVRHDAHVLQELTALRLVHAAVVLWYNHEHSILCIRACVCSAGAWKIIQTNACFDVSLLSRFAPCMGCSRATSSKATEL